MLPFSSQSLEFMRAARDFQPLRLEDKRMWPSGLAELESYVKSNSECSGHLDKAAPHTGQ